MAPGISAEWTTSRCCDYWRGNELLPCQMAAVSSLPTYPEVLHDNHTCYRESVKQVAQGGGLAEEVFSTIRTVHAFGVQKALAKLYARFVERSLRLDHKSAAANAIGLGLFTFVVYGTYALGELILAFRP